MCSLNFKTLVLFLISISAIVGAYGTTPVLIWGAKCESKPALQVVETSEFADIVGTLLEDHMLIVLLTSQLKPKDFLCRQSINHTKSCFDFLQNVEPKTYYAAVDQPQKVFEELQDKITHTTIDDCLTGNYRLQRFSQCQPGSLHLIEFKSSCSVERSLQLQQHDRFIEFLMQWQAKDCSIAYMYMSGTLAKEENQELLLKGQLHHVKRQVPSSQPQPLQPQVNLQTNPKLPSLETDPPEPPKTFPRPSLQTEPPQPSQSLPRPSLETEPPQPSQRHPRPSLQTKPLERPRVPPRPQPEEEESLVPPQPVPEKQEVTEIPSTESQQTAPESSDPKKEETLVPPQPVPEMQEVTEIPSTESQQTAPESSDPNPEPETSYQPFQHGHVMIYFKNCVKDGTVFRVVDMRSQLIDNKHIKVNIQGAEPMVMEIGVSTYDYQIDKFTIGEKVYEIKPAVKAPKKLAYATNAFKAISENGNKFKCENFQMEVFKIELPADKPHKFSDAWHGDAFFTAGMLMGYFVSSILLGILGLGICMMIDIGRNDKMDDANGKRLVITVPQVSVDK